jgi:hypothetical protein
VIPVRYKLNVIYDLVFKDGLEYLHRCPASRKRRHKGNQVPGGITGPPCSWGDINTGTWPSRLGESQIRQKIWL